MSDEALRTALFRTLAARRAITYDPVRGGVRFVERGRRLFATDDQIERVLDEIGRFEALLGPPRHDEDGSAPA